MYEPTPVANPPIFFAIFDIDPISSSYPKPEYPVSAL
jgi:hypothetical protein